MGIQYKFNPVTGEIDLVDVYSPTVGGTYNVEKFTLDATAITNKNITLAQTPATGNLTRMVVVTDGGGEQDFGTDFTLSGNQITWDGLNLDGILTINDKIIIIYT